MPVYRVIRIAMRDRPGALSAVTASLAAHGVDIVRLDVVSHDGESVVDDLLLAAPLADDIGAAVAGFLPDVVVRTFEGLPGDPTIEMGAGLREVARAKSVEVARAATLSAAKTLLRADEAALLQAEAGGELRVVASTTDLPDIRASEPFAGRWALERLAAAAFPPSDSWAPEEFQAALAPAWVAIAPCSDLRLILVTRSINIAFFSGELERLRTFSEAAEGILGMKGDRIEHGFALAGAGSSLPARALVLQNHIGMS